LSFLTLKRPANPIFLWLLCCHFFQGENVQKAFRGRYFQNLQWRFGRVMQFEYGNAKKRRSYFKGSFWLKNKYRHFRLKRKTFWQFVKFCKRIWKMSIYLDEEKLMGLAEKTFFSKLFPSKSFSSFSFILCRRFSFISSNAFLYFCESEKRFKLQFQLSSKVFGEKHLFALLS
jgi:hypothetical protein